MKPSLPKLRSFLVPAIACLLVLVVVSSAWACPTCKEGLAGDPQARRMAEGYYYSILFMMAMPFLLLGSFSSYAYLAVCRARRESESD